MRETELAMMESLESENNNNKDNVSTISELSHDSATTTTSGEPDAVSNHSAASSTASIVMRYAESEKNCIRLSKERETLQTTLDDATKQNQALKDELERVKAECERKCADMQQELEGYKKENDKFREQQIMSDSRLKVAEISKMNLTKEIELANAAKDKLAQENEALTKKLNELNQKFDTTSLSEQLPDKSGQLQRELNVLNSQLRDMFEERTSLRDSIKCLHQERILLETNLAKYKKDLENMTSLHRIQSEDVAKMKETINELKRARKEKIDSQERIVSLNNELEELQAELYSNKTKQEELLLFTSRLTEKNIEIKGENQALDERLQKLQTDYDELKNEHERLKETLKSDQEIESTIRTQLKHNEEVGKSLKEQLEAKEQELEEARTLLSDERDENATMKKKHTAIVKDMSRQLQVLQKKLDSATSQDCKSEASCTSPVGEFAFGFHDSNNNVVSGAELLTALGSQSNSPDDDSSKYYFGDMKKLIEKTMKLQNELEEKNDHIELLLNKIRQLTARVVQQTSLYYDDTDVEIRM